MISALQDIDFDVVESLPVYLTLAEWRELAEDYDDDERAQFWLHGRSQQPCLLIDDPDLDDHYHRLEPLECEFTGDEFGWCCDACGLFVSRWEEVKMPDDEYCYRSLPLCPGWSELPVVPLRHQTGQMILRGALV